MSLSECLGITSQKGLSAIVGGGGKTTLMYRLAEEISEKGESVVVTTTTKIMKPPQNICVYSDALKLPERLLPGAVVCLGVPVSQGKLSHPGERALHFAAGCCDKIIAEADGARGFPIKAPAEHEPVIPDWCDTVIGVAGLDAIGKPLNEICFRYELVCDMLGVTSDTIVTPHILARLIMNERGQRKGIPEKASFSVLLNKADDKRRVLLGIETAKEIDEIVPHTRVIIAALKDKEAVKAIYG